VSWIWKTKMMGMARVFAPMASSNSVITAYNTFPTKVMSTVTTAWHQQKWALLKNGSHDNPHYWLIILHMSFSGLVCLPLTSHPALAVCR
jgi:hypothetical protein